MVFCAPRRTVLPLAVSGSLQRPGRTARPCPAAGLAGVRTWGAGRTRRGSGRLRLPPRRAGPGPFPLRRHKEPPNGGGQVGRQPGFRGSPRRASWPQAGRRRGRREGGDPFLCGASSEPDASRESRAACAPPLSRLLFRLS